jgi:hypothetical protein
MPDSGARTQLKQHRVIAQLGMLRFQRATGASKAADEKVRALAADHETAVKALQSAEQGWASSLKGGPAGAALTASWATELIRQDGLRDYRATLLVDAREDQDRLEKARRTAEARKRIGETLLRKAVRTLRQSEEDALLAELPSNATITRSAR